MQTSVAALLASPANIALNCIMSELISGEREDFQISLWTKVLSSMSAC